METDLDIEFAAVRGAKARFARDVAVLYLEWAARIEKFICVADLSPADREYFTNRAKDWRKSAKQVETDAKFIVDTRALILCVNKLIPTRP